jgi:hypothetical protein
MATTQGESAIPADLQPHELTKLIRKLRWIGMDKEAHRLEAAMAALPIGERGADATKPSGAAGAASKPQREM